MTEDKDDYTISDYVSQNFGMLIGETMTCISCHQYMRPKVLKDDSFIIPLVENSSKKMRPIRHDKTTHLDINCVTMNEFMDNIYGKTNLRNVICEEFSKLNGKSGKANF